jgi:hypothetical protein
MNPDQYAPPTTLSAQSLVSQEEVAMSNTVTQNIPLFEAFDMV